MLRSSLLYTCLVILLGSLSFFCVHAFPAFHFLEHKLYDLRIYFQSQSQAHSDIVLVQVGTEEYQPLLQFLSQMPPRHLRAVGLDLPELYSLQPQQILALAQIKHFPLVLSSYLTLTDGENKGVYLTHTPSFKKWVQIGHANFTADSDGILREQPVFFPYRERNTGQTKISYSFAWQLFQTLEPRAVMSQKQRFIYYPGPNQIYRLHSLGELQRKPLQQLKNKILIFSDQMTPYLTPYRSHVTRLELHAYSLAGLLNQQTYQHPWGINLLISILMALGALGLLWGVLRWGNTLTILSLVALGLGYLIFNIWVFNRFLLWLDVLAPLMALLSSAGLVSSYLYQIEGKERRVLLNTFKRHLPDKKVRQLMVKQEAESLLQNERKIVTVMFTDMRGFSSMGEKLPPNQIVQVLNEYLTAMTEIIFNNGGTLDKYIGDGIMAVYGNIGKNNPKEDAYFAVKTALEMQKEMEHLQTHWMNQGLRPVQMRIGINTGDALVGYVGHPERKEVTVIGDTVNTAARIEKLNKQYNTQILMSHSTYEYVKEVTEVQAFGEKKLPGKSSGVKVYELKGWRQ